MASRCASRVTRGASDLLSRRLHPGHPVSQTRRRFPRRAGLTAAPAAGMPAKIVLKRACELMRRAWAIVVCAAAVAGCLTRSERPSGASVARSLAPAAPVEGVYLESVLLERP